MIKFFFVEESWKLLPGHLQPLVTAHSVTKADYTLVSIDGRGKHGNHPSVALEVKKSLDSLVQRIPKYRSHYKQFGTDSRYLSPGVSKLDVYELLKQECVANNFLTQ